MTGSVATFQSGASVLSCRASRIAYAGKPQMLSGHADESERSRSESGICEFLQRYAYCS
jgi:hypothetical protein